MGFKFIERSKFITFLVISVSVLVLSQNCGGEFQAIDAVSIASQCRKSTATKAASFKNELHRQAPDKVLFGAKDLSSETIAPQGFNGKIDLSSPMTEATLSRSQNFLAIIDNQCVKEGLASEFTVNEILNDSLVDEDLPVQAYAFNFRDIITVRDLVIRMNQDPCVVFISANEKVQLSAVQYTDWFAAEPRRTDQLNYMRMVGADSFSSSQVGKTVPGESVLVAVVDSGVDLEHPDLKNKIALDSNGQKGKSYVSGAPTAQDDHAHGTHVAGLISAEANGAGTVGVSGVTPIKILPVKVLDRTATGNMSQVINGLNYAINENADVINLSLGEPANAQNSPLYEAIIKNATNSGTLMIVASGNNNADLSTFAPAHLGYLPGIISVGSIDTDSKQKSTFSNFCGTVCTSHPGEKIMLNAPGSSSNSAIGLLSTVPSAYNPTNYAYFKGTSMATPIVSAAAAYAYSHIRSAGGNPSPTAVKNLLFSTAQPDASYGLVSIKNVFDELNRTHPLAAPTPAPGPTPTPNPAPMPSPTPGEQVQSGNSVCP